jgi:hypothetical protein
VDRPPTEAEFLRALFGPRWAVARKTPNNLARYGRCVTKAEHDGARQLYRRCVTKAEYDGADLIFGVAQTQDGQ